MPQNGMDTKKYLAQQIRKNRRKLFDWQLGHARLTPSPFYCSVDLRDSGHKIAPVDSNLYPAGFNNICPDDLRTAPQVIQAQLESLASSLKMETLRKVLILPECHTSNSYYIENLYYLKQIFENAGVEVRIGWYGALPDGAQVPLKLVSATGKELSAFPIRIENGIAQVDGFVPDVVLLNNDFSSGYPKPLDEVKQPILPSHVLGWHSRKKTEHFKYYNQLASEFAEIVGIDPWIIQIDTEESGPVNFSEGQGIEEVAQSVERVLQRTKEAYARHGVDYPPFAFVKNNSGTYGMGIMVVHSADELRQMNRRTKNKMSVGKNKLPIDSVAVQEGIPTATLIDRLAAEPVIYLVGCELIGGFLRTNTEKGVEENLNSQGMVFKKLCMTDLRRPSIDEPSEAEENGEEEPVLELVYGSIARISALATGMELTNHAKGTSHVV